MTLHVLMYHRAREGLYGNSLETLDRHFEWLSANFPSVLPGETAAAGGDAVCISFDDAYCDFHRHVLALLERHDLRALLAIAPGLLPRGSVSLTPAARLALVAGESDLPAGSAGYCTWDELREVVKTGRVAIASHGFDHVRLDAPSVDLHREVVDSKIELEFRLGCAVNTFVYPFGRCPPQAQELVAEHYRSGIRIGDASNEDWSSPLIYRIDADCEPDVAALFTRRKRLGRKIRRYWNRRRGK